MNSKVTDEGGDADLIKKFVSPTTFCRVEMCHQDSVIREIKLGQKKGVIRDIIWQHNQKLWNLRCFQLLSNKKTCTKVLEIQKLAGFDCVSLKCCQIHSFEATK